ncbi:glycosyltransferase [Alteromonas pelagimontana]|uniref:Glycosyltransferase n=1 Tax=Alteromonas pelagimontana TaxID=1858656 RepID=A0A6M4MF35_9ALTE|nr:glycosyltransferase [Alteromonas pelagimontana]QJR81607.1 glycosyltransferase [Alteromonas pelagimontana]
MKILHAYATRLALPAKKYGGTERVIWSLAQAQMRAGHTVKFLARNAGELANSTLKYDRNKPVQEQITDWPDIVHFHWPFDEELAVPYLCTEHGNAGIARDYNINTVFVSQKHAQNHNATCFVYNGLEWSEYGSPNLNMNNSHFHFLGKARALTKNLPGAINIAKNTGNKLRVLGGSRFNFGRNSYFSFDKHVRFHGMVGGENKNHLIKNSRGLIFPVRWEEPFGLAITESLFLGCPVFASPYGSLPELVKSEKVGFLSASYGELEDAVRRYESFDRKACHELAREEFNADVMCRKYSQLYERVASGQALNAQRPYSTKDVTEILPLKE